MNDSEWIHRSREVLTKTTKRTPGIKSQIHIAVRILSSARVALATAFLSVLFLLSIFRAARAQDSSLIYGVGMSSMVSTDDGFGLGFRGRVSTPINADLSFAADLGVTGFFLGGRDDSSFLFNPQISAIVTVPGERSAMYFMTGIGAYLSTGGDDGEYNGPTLHVGVGGAKPLRDTTLFYEFNPALVIKDDSIALVLPVRIGIIL